MENEAGATQLQSFLHSLADVESADQSASSTLESLQALAVLLLACQLGAPTAFSFYPSATRAADKALRENHRHHACAMSQRHQPILAFAGEPEYPESRMSPHHAMSRRELSGRAILAAGALLGGVSAVDAATPATLGAYVSNPLSAQAAYNFEDLNIASQEKVRKLLKPEQLQEFLDELQLQQDREQEALEAASGDKFRKLAGQLERNLAAQARLQDRLSTLDDRTSRAAKLAALDAQPDWFNYVAGFAASCVSALLVFPLDALKARAIASGAKSGGSDMDDSPEQRILVKGKWVKDDGDPLEIIAKNVLDDPKDIRGGSQTNAVVAENVQRFLSLYKGLLGGVAKDGPSSAIYLGTYQVVRDALMADKQFVAYPILVSLIAGAVGATSGSLTGVPAEALKSRVQSGIDPSLGESFNRVLLDKTGRENIKAAFGPALWRDVPNGALQLTIFEALKLFVVDSPLSFLDIDADTLAAEVVLGTIAGAVSNLVTAPADVVTTRIMQQTVDEIEACEEPLGFGGMFEKIKKEGGWTALYTGWKQNIGAGAPSIGIFLACYCSIRRAAIDSGIFPLAP